MTATRYLDFDIDWLSSQPKRVTTANLCVRIKGHAIWPVYGEPDARLEVQVDDLLSHLVEFWKPLLLRQTYPILETPERPSLLWAEVEKRWATQPTSVVAKEEERIDGFEEAHNLSRAFAGVFGLPHLWMLRAGDQMIVEGPHSLDRVPFQEAVNALTDVGNRVAKRLDEANSKWELLTESWRSRDQGDQTNLLAWSTSLERGVAQWFLELGTLSAPASVSEAASDDDELRIAARMASALPPSEIRHVIEEIRKFPPGRAPNLDDLSMRARHNIQHSFAGRRAYEQGEAAAAFVRSALKVASTDFVDVFSVVESLGVDLRLDAVEPPSLDGLAVWGSRHGPAILLNTASNRIVGRDDVRKDSSARITLAHEFCHLLLDRAHTLSAVDVLNSRMPLDIERRSKSFAGEFLLPARAAAELWDRMGRPHSLASLTECIDQLCNDYGVTRSVATWKLEHGLHRQNLDLGPSANLRVLLDVIAPQR